MKALVDYWLARERGEFEERKTGLLKVGNKLYLPMPSQLTTAMQKGLKKLSASKSFRLFPVFWQVFLWGWDGFLIKDELDHDYAQLANETGVLVDEVPLALTAFDETFPTPGGWFREPDGDTRRVLILMPAAMRGIGAHRRRASQRAILGVNGGPARKQRTRLNNEKMKSLRQLHQSGTPLTKLATQFGIARDTARRIVRGETWRSDGI